MAAICFKILKMIISYTTFILLISQTLVQSVTFDPRILAASAENVPVTLRQNRPQLDRESWEFMVRELPTENLNRKVDNLIQNGNHKQLLKVLGHVPDQLVDRAIQIGNLQALNEILKRVFNTDLAKYVKTAASKGRLDMIVAIAKHGDANTVKQAFIEIIDKSKKPKYFLALLMRETNQVPGSSDAAYQAYATVMKSRYPDKVSLVNSFISNLNSKDVSKYIRPLSKTLKNEILLHHASKLDKRIVKVFADSKDDLNFEKALQYFVAENSWDYILSLSRQQPISVANVILKNANYRDRSSLFGIFLSKMNGLSKDMGLIYVYRKVAAFGDIDLMSMVFEKLRKEMKHGESSMNTYIAKKFSTGVEHDLFQQNPSPGYWIILDGIKDAASSNQFMMVRTLLSKVDISHENNLALRYLVLLNNEHLIQIILEDSKVLKTGVKAAIPYARSQKMIKLLKSADKGA